MTVIEYLIELEEELKFLPKSKRESTLIVYREKINNLIDLGEDEENIIRIDANDVQEIATRINKLVNDKIGGTKRWKRRKWNRSLRSLQSNSTRRSRARANIGTLPRKPARTGTAILPRICMRSQNRRCITRIT